MCRETPAELQSEFYILPSRKTDVDASRSAIVLIIQEFVRSWSRQPGEIHLNANQIIKHLNLIKNQSTTRSSTGDILTYRRWVHNHHRSQHGSNRSLQEGATCPRKKKLIYLAGRRPARRSSQQREERSFSRPLRVLPETSRRLRSSTAELGGTIWARMSG